MATNYRFNGPDSRELTRFANEVDRENFRVETVATRQDIPPNSRGRIIYFVTDENVLAFYTPDGTLTEVRGGGPGAQGRFNVDVYRRHPSVPAAPVGGTYINHTLTSPEPGVWLLAPEEGVDELYQSFATIDPFEDIEGENQEEELTTSGVTGTDTTYSIQFDTNVRVTPLVGTFPTGFTASEQADVIANAVGLTDEVGVTGVRGHVRDNVVTFIHTADLETSTTTITYGGSLGTSVTPTLSVLQLGVTQSSTLSAWSSPFVAGQAGVDAIVVKLLPSTQVIRYSEGENPEETTTITFDLLVQGVPPNTHYAFLVDDALIGAPSTVRTFTLPQANEPGLGQQRVITVEAREGGPNGDVLAMDTETVYALQDGSDAITQFLDNSQHTVPATLLGTVTDLADAGGTYRVFGGATDLAGMPGVVFSRTDTNTLLLDATIDATTGIYGVTSFATNNAMGDLLSNTFATFQVFIPSGTLTGLEEDMTFQQQYSISKALTGDTGATGDGANVVKLIPNFYVIRYDEQGVQIPISIELSTTFEQGVPGTIRYRFQVDSFDRTTGTSSTYTLEPGDEPGESGQVDVSVDVLLTPPGQAERTVSSDTVTIYGVKNGSGGITAFLTNESHTEAASEEGVLTGNLDDAGGSFVILVGATNVTSSCSFSVASPSPNITSAIGASDGLYSFSSFLDGADNASVTFQASIPGSVVDGSVNPTVVQRTYSVSKSRQGILGSGGFNASTVQLIPTPQQIVFNPNGDEAPETTIRCTTNVITESTETLGYTFLVEGMSPVTNTTGEFILPDAMEPNTMNAVEISVSVTETTGMNIGQVIAFDSVSVFGLLNGSNGIDGVVGFLSNEAHTVVAGADGTVVSTAFTGSGGDFKVFAGAVDISARSDVVFSVADMTAGLTQIINPGTGVYSITSLAQGVNQAQVIYRATIAAAAIPEYTGADLVIDRTYSISKSIEGASADTIRTITLFQVTDDSAGEPAAPAEDVGFTSAGQAVNAPPWGVVALNPGTDQTGYQAQKILIQRGSINNYVSDTNWLVGEVVSAAGPEGPGGAPAPRVSVGIVYATDTGTTAPAFPSGVTYSWVSGTFSSLGTVWSFTAPTADIDGQTNYFTGAVTATETITMDVRTDVGVAIFSNPSRAFDFAGVLTVREATGETVIDGAVTTISGNNIRTGALISTGTPPSTAGEVPGAGEEGSHFNLTGGALTVGNDTTFMRFNTTDGLVVGGIQNYSRTLSIYFQGAEPPPPADTTVTIGEDGSFVFTTPSGWVDFIPDTTDEIWVTQALVERRGEGTATADWVLVSLFRTATVTAVTLAQTGGPILASYSSATDFSASYVPSNQNIVVTATPAGGGTVETATYNLGIQNGTYATRLDINTNIIETDSGNNFTFVDPPSFAQTLFIKRWIYEITHSSSGATVSIEIQATAPSGGLPP